MIFSNCNLARYSRSCSKQANYVFTNFLNNILDNRDTSFPAEEKLILLDNDHEKTCFIQLNKIGEGACGSVYLCKNKETGVYMALKQVDVSFKHKKLPEKVKALYQEMENLKKLKHKYIVKYYGVHHDNKSVSLLMEYVKGGSIFDLIVEKGAVHERDISKYCLQILEGLSYMHDNNIVHRDLKCANILLDEFNNCKLADFGISKHAEDIRSMEGCKTDIGTPYWMSPECIQGLSYGWKSDIWSFGCTVLEMLNTKPPYRDLNNQTAMYKIVHEDLVLYFRPGTSDHCMEFIKQCLHKDPKLRPSAQDLLNFKFISVYNEF